jgi:hypothetical protein
LSGVAKPAKLEEAVASLREIGEGLTREKLPTGVR